MLYAFLKRSMDLILATGALLVFLPLFVVVIPAMLLTQGAPIFFRQPRAGRGGEPFLLWKFRTMREGAAAREAGKPVSKDHNDPRITPLGRWLRRYEIDELPQFFNILTGEMSFIGPRPLPVADLEHPAWLEGVDETERARRLHWLATRQQVKPGLSGLWQISTPHEADFENWMACDIAYVERRNIGLDLWILACTPWAIVRGREKR